MKIKTYKKIFNPFLYFFKSEASSGVILLICAIAAMVIANSDLASSYDHILHRYITIGYRELSLSMSVLHWINDGLMAIFFFVVGMEIKREVAIGELKSIKKTILPVAAAVGGMIVPAIIYMVFNYNEATITGWGIPMATDIAFALGVLSLVGKNAPKGILIFLTALAIVDDLGAIIVIAVFYTSQISKVALIAALIVLGLLILANKLKVKSTAVFVIGGIILWIAVLKSGIHATIAGVLLGMVIPAGKNINEFKNSMLYKLEHTLTPYSAFVIMPIFALANSGVAIDIKSFLTVISAPVSLGIIFGLFIGKQVGVFGVSYLLVKFKIAKLPSQVTKKHLYGASVLAGIGFTMSLFVASLSFVDETILSTAKISIILASLLSAILGMVIFKFSKPESRKR
ncbi:Na+/H+ antiporter NhaA [Clostridium magnum]|uniref:Na(+)/H(+) antiporter NhaA n=1 Tax=Clostridium magnum DSM 2767 TaxID=1121326 RepID=A0A161WSQ6_9CLOT|nr:Na+/H+ antiporter NhaA [Clostridium magnum]KZL89838.1 Na(+)/H(+) antiporter NhaA [Clostridium magnum DSM 2767]SHI70226.1 Na+:H+ antiporter, NhaA family [Clostridium magnum DSM 2767]